MTKIIIALILVDNLPIYFLPLKAEHCFNQFIIDTQKVYQYMAICTDGHGVLSPWIDTQKDANKYGKDHEVLTKGHRWKIDFREKPIPKKDSTSINPNHLL